MPAIRHSLKDRGSDLYETCPEAVHALLAIEKLPMWIWEPAAGRGAIVDVLRQAGHAVVATDLVDYGVPMQATGRDFLLEREAPHQCKCILTNPPFSLATDFVRVGLRLCPKVIMLLRLAFLESEGRSDILDGGQLARVHVFRNRLPMLHRDGWTGNKASSTMAFGWFVFDRDHKGPAKLNRISWRPLNAD